MRLVGYVMKRMDEQFCFYRGCLYDGLLQPREFCQKLAEMLMAERLHLMGRGLPSYTAAVAATAAVVARSQSLIWRLARHNCVPLEVLEYRWLRSYGQQVAAEFGVLAEDLIPLLAELVAQYTDLRRSDLSPQAEHFDCEINRTDDTA